MARWICKVTRYKGQTRITLPKGLVKSLQWEDAGMIELRKLPGYLVIMERFPYGKEKRAAGRQPAAGQD